MTADLKPIVVLDASVILKWLLLEKEDVADALKIREDLLNKRVEVYVPSHLFTEVCNVLGRQRPEQMLRFLSELRMSRLLECRLTLEIASLALNLLTRYPKISFYDAAYHALAIHSQGTFITADVKYYQTTQKEGHICLLNKYLKTFKG